MVAIFPFLTVKLAGRPVTDPILTPAVATAFISNSEQIGIAIKLAPGINWEAVSVIAEFAGMAPVEYRNT